ncbi:filamin-C-like [Sycon ciliatum]|uniref:filamin-C-like n=1 Tax=Sycon ciliatum TaxID=27933 RepID=UPI0031F68390
MATHGQGDMVRGVMDAVDSDWQKIQIKAFTNWFNDRLRGNLQKAPVVVNDITIDLCDGILLCQMVEGLLRRAGRGTKFRYNKKPKLKQHRLENLGIVLKTLKDQKIKLVNIGPEDLMAGSLKLWLGLIWTLIDEFQIKTAKGGSSKKALLDWVNAQLPPSKRVTNFTTDWNDGTCLCTLIDTLRPGLCPNHASLNPSSGLQNCDLGMSLAEQHLSVPKLLDPADLNNPIVDQLSVMTYISYFTDTQVNGLLQWIRQRLPEQDIQNITTDWNNGILLSALVDSFAPGLIPHHDALSPTRALENVKNAMKIAKERLGINSDGITANEITNPKVDELAMSAYLTVFKECTLKASPGQCIADGPGLKAVPLNVPAEFRVDCSQAGQGDLKIEAKGPSSDAKVKTTTGDEDQKDTYQAVYTPQELGTYTVSVKYDKEHIPDSPFSVPCVDPSACHVTGKSLGGQGSVVGEPLEFQVDTSAAGPGTVEPTLFGPTGIQPVQLKDSGNGKSVRMSSTPTSPGSYSLDLKLSGLPIPGSPFAIAVSDPSKCRLLTSFQDGHLGKVGTPIDVAVDTSRAGPGVLTAVATGTSRTVRLEARDGGDSTSTIAFVPSEAGQHSVDILWDGHSIPGCPLGIPVIDVSLCCFEDLPSYAQVARPLALRLLTQQSIKAPLVVTAQNESGSRVPSTVKADGADAYKISLTPAQVGTMEIDATWAGDQVSQCPFDVQVCDASRCSAYGLGLTEAAKVGEPVTFTVQAKDAGEGSLIVKPAGPKAVYSATVMSNGDGTYEVSFTPWEKGPHTIAISWGIQQIPNSPFPLEVTGRILASQITASGDGLKEATALAPAEFQVVSSIPADLTEGDLLAVTIEDGAEKAAVDVADLGEGRCAVTYVAPSSGTYTIAVMFAGEHTSGSPHIAVVSSRPNASRCVVNGACFGADAKPLAGDPLDFTVETGAAGKSRLNVAGTDMGGRPCRVFMANDDDDVYSVRVDTKNPGAYTIAVKWADEHVPGSPFTVATGSRITAQSMHVEGPGLKSGKTGEEASFTIHTPKAGLIDTGELTVQVCSKLAGVELKDLKILDNDGGKYSVTYKPLVAEEHVVTVRFDDQNLPGSPFVAVITARPMADQCVAAGDCLEKNVMCVMDEPLEFEINATAAGNGRLVVKAEGPEGEVLRAFQSEEEEGVYSIRLDTSAGLGTYSVQCLWSGSHIPGSPFQLTVGEKLTAQMVSAHGDGLREVYAMKEATFSVSAKKPDLFDTGALKMTVVGDKGHVGLAVADNQDGTYAVTYMAPTDGQYSVSIFLNGEDVPGSPFSVIAYLPPKADRCMARGHCLEPDGKMMVGKSAEFTVNTTDAGHGKMSLKATDPGGKSIRTFLSDDGEGIYTVRIDPKESGAYRVEVRWSGEHIPGSPFSLTATDGLSPGTITASGTGLSRAFSLMPTAFTLDAPEAGLLERNDLTVTIDSALHGKPAEVEVRDLGDGTYSVNYMAPGNGAFLASIKYRGVHIPASPFKITVFPRPSPEKCRAFGKCLEPKVRNICGKPIDFKVATSEAGYGRLVVRAQDPHGSPTPAFVAEEGKNLYIVRLDVKEAGKYMINVKWGNTPIPGSPFKLRVHVATDASKVKADGPGLRSTGVPVGRETSFVLRTHDAGMGSLVVRMHGIKDNFKIKLEKDRDDSRLLHAKYTPKEVGDYEITILWSEVHIPNSPFKVPIVDPHGRPKERARAQQPGPAKKKLVKVTKTQPGMTYVDDSGRMVHTDDPAMIARLEMEQQHAAAMVQTRQAPATKRTVEERRVVRRSRNLNESHDMEAEQRVERRRSRDMDMDGDVVIGGGLPPARHRRDRQAQAQAGSSSAAAAASRTARSPQRAIAAAAAAPESRRAQMPGGKMAQPEYHRSQLVQKPSQRRASFTEDDISPEFDHVFAAGAPVAAHKAFKKSASASSVEQSSSGWKSGGKKKMARKQSESAAFAVQRQGSISTKARGTGFMLDPTSGSKQIFTGELRGNRQFRLPS